MGPYCHLKTKSGQFFDVRKFKCKNDDNNIKKMKNNFVLKLQVVDEQNKAHNVRIFHENEGQMAFCFKHGGQHYHLKVNDKQQLELENGQGEKPDTSVTQYWFKRQDVGSGDHYVLCTMASPVQYLGVSEDSVTLHGSNCVLVIHEA